MSSDRLKVTKSSANKLSTISVNCNATEFACTDSKTCISKLLHCDGKADCKFKEDEIECSKLRIAIN